METEQMNLKKRKPSSSSQSACSSSLPSPAPSLEHDPSLPSPEHEIEHDENENENEILLPTPPSDEASPDSDLDPIHTRYQIFISEAMRLSTLCNATLSNHEHIVPAAWNEFHKLIENECSWYNTYKKPEQKKVENKSTCRLITNLSRSPLKCVYFNPTLSMSRNELQQLTSQQKKKLIPLPVRIMGNIQNTSQDEFYFVAKDMGQLILTHKGKHEKKTELYILLSSY
jgi:hypothetical protein